MSQKPYLALLRSHFSQQLCLLFNSCMFCFEQATVLQYTQYVYINIIISILCW